MRLDDAGAMFLRVKRREGLTKSSIDSYAKTLALVYRQFPDISTDDFGRWQAEEFIDGLARMAPATIAHHTRNLKAFCRWMLAEELTDEDIFRKIKVRRVPQELHDLIPVEDFRKLLDVCKASRRMNARRDYAILCFLWDTGVRVSELCSLADADVDLAAGVAKVWGKGSKERFVFFSGETALALERYRIRRESCIKQSDRFFLTDEGRTMDTFAVRRMLDRLKKKSGVTSKINPHAFRHTFATNYLRAGGDLNSLQRLLGHADLSIVTRYLSLTQDDLAEKHRQFSPMNSLGSRSGRG